VPPRPLHAVLLPEIPLALLAAALDGSGPALLPLDPGLPPARLAELLGAFAPSAIVTQDGVESLPAGDRQGLAEDVAVVLGTSGSTGVPKGAEITASALLASARASLGRIGGDGGGRWLCCLPTHHISGLGVLVRSLVTGTEPLVVDRVDASVIAGCDCDYVSLVPTQLGRLLAAGAPLDRFLAILLGGAAIPGELLAAAAAAGARVVTTYGMTETCGGCVYDGVPLDGVEVGNDQDGRIRIRGPVLFSRYRLAPALTRDCLRDGWFTTSDLGGLGADGRLSLRGRADDVINTGGEKVVPAEVEAVLRRCEGVADVAVVGVPDPDWGEQVVAIVVPAVIASDGSVAAPNLGVTQAPRTTPARRTTRGPGPGAVVNAGPGAVVNAGPGVVVNAGPGAPSPPGAPPPAGAPTLERLSAAVRATLPRYAAPRRVVYIDQLPMLASGKPDRLRLRDIASSEA
jgi:O-succinylbenzoic acid--CoA ligase